MEAAQAEIGMRILAIDPGNTESAWVDFDGSVIDCGIVGNEEMLTVVRGAMKGQLAIEMIESFGMPVGKEVFETVFWSGRFIQAWEPRPWVKVYRKEVKLHLCQSPRAKDPNIRQALLDRIGPQGTKKDKGPTYGIKSHLWAALAVAVYAADHANGSTVSPATVGCQGATSR